MPHLRLIVGFSAALCLTAGCAQPLFSGGDPAAMHLKDPDASFMKKVDKDPFPRAAGAPLPMKSTK
jgi:hypothetical protein